jgi:hypothetical protein
MGMSPANVMNTTLPGMLGQTSQFGNVADAIDDFQIETPSRRQPGGDSRANDLARELSSMSETRFVREEALASFESGMDLWAALMLVKRE